MTQAQKTHADAGTASLIQAAAVAFALAVALSATVLIAAPYAFTIDLGAINQPQTTQSLIKAEAAWELQRKQQMINGGASSAVVNSSLSWEQQRLQQAHGRQSTDPVGPTGPTVPGLR